MGRHFAIRHVSARRQFLVTMFTTSRLSLTPNQSEPGKENNFRRRIVRSDEKSPLPTVLPFPTGISTTQPKVTTPEIQRVPGRDPIDHKIASKSPKRAVTAHRLTAGGNRERRGYLYMSLSCASISFVRSFVRVVRVSTNIIIDRMRALRSFALQEHCDHSCFMTFRG